eukprot:augustus_masked-scaffold_13-processed-gene-2.8-mRNA-1 protein AED:0.24 eAED:0.24 QI:0/-1/0/1/-1/1/1/0/700
MYTPQSANPDKDTIPDYAIRKSTYQVSKDPSYTIPLSKKGYASGTPQTIPNLFKHQAEIFRNEEFYFVEEPEPKVSNGTVPEGVPLSQWTSWTYGEVLDQVYLVSQALIKLGFKKLDGVSILGFNHPCWMISSFAGMFSGGVSCGLYGTDSVEQLSYKINLSDTFCTFLDDEKNLEKFVEVSKNCSDLQVIVMWKDLHAVEKYRSKFPNLKLLKWNELLEIGKTGNKTVVENRIKAIKPTQCANIVFTSGTTGVSKGTMLSHDTLYFQVLTLRTFFPEVFQTLTKIKIISFLPLSHVAAYTHDVLNVMALPIITEYKGHAQIYFARSYDLKRGSLLDRIKTVKPHFLGCVPRVFEKIQEAMERVSASPTSRRISSLSNHLSKEDPLEKFGLGNCYVFESGGAPLKKETYNFFQKYGRHIGEVLGMSEGAGMVTYTSSSHKGFGSVGLPVPGTEVKVFQLGSQNERALYTGSSGNVPEEFQGEICLRGRNMLMGYLVNPKLGSEHVDYMTNKNKEAIDEYGWYHTGDKGYKDSKGMLHMTGRYKEIILGSGGENIAPGPIENDFKERCQCVSNVIMIGNNRKYNVALVTLKCQGATGVEPGTSSLVDGAILGEEKSVEEACNSEKYIQYVVDKLNETNSNGKVIFNNTFKIQKFSILPRDFSVNTGELTSSLKLKRSVVEDKYKELIDKIYDTPGVFFNSL